MEEKGREGRREDRKRGEPERIYDPVPRVSLLAVTGPQSGIAGSGARAAQRSE